LVLTEQLQQVLQEWDRVVVLDETEQEASVHKIVTSHEHGGDVFLHVQVFEVDIVWKQMLCWSLMQCDVETFQALGVGVVFGSLQEPDPVDKVSAGSFGVLPKQSDD
jgi:hypothetical protein